MTESPANDQPVLRHVAVIGGTPDEWEQLGDADWTVLLEELGKVADHAGASWLTLRPVAPGPGSPVRRQVAAGACTVIAAPDADGRARMLRAMSAIQARGEVISERAIDAEIDAPASNAPDLVLVLGTNDRLPASMVWELAYSELVYLDVAWTALQPEHLGQAIAAYAQRHRRFGGLD